MKNIVITGGSSGLGKAMVESLSKDNNVIALDINLNSLMSVANSTGCKYKVCDVSDSTKVEEVFNEIILENDSIDILINNAGLWIQDELDTNSYERIKAVVDVNLLGVINCSRAVVPSMKERKSGLIINIGSQAGINHKSERSVYNSTKWGVTGFSKCLVDEVSKYGIRVTDVMPSLIKTNLFKNNDIERDLSNGLDSDEIVKLIRFIMDLPDDVLITEVGIKNINY